MNRTWRDASKLSALLGLALLLGCNSSKSVEGKTKIDSTDYLKSNKGTKSPPPKKPGQ